MNQRQGSSPQIETRTPGLVFTVCSNAAVLVGFGALLIFDTSSRDSFSWMDPYQYYGFAQDVLEGQRGFSDFQVPSLFPLFILPFLAASGPSIPHAFWVHIAFTILLLIAVQLHCKDGGLRTPSAIISLLILGTPLLFGLSRELYVEFSLTAVVTLGFAFWSRMRTAHPQDPPPQQSASFLFAMTFAIGVMTKMTFPIFFILPIGAVLLSDLLEHRFSHIRLIIWSTLLPGLFVLGVQAAFFPNSFGYYLSLGNTQLPVMYLIGPPELLSWGSLSYYWITGATCLFLIAPLLLISLWPLRHAPRRPWPERLRSRTSMLWLWCLGPLLLLTFQNVKEPRHIAPSVVPAILLMIEGIESLPWRRPQRLLLGLAVSLSVVQVALIEGHWIEAPYFMNRAVEWAQIEAALDGYDSVPPPRDRLEDIRRRARRYNQNILVGGFSPNEALSLTWQAFPAVVYTLETLERPEQLSRKVPFERFEDLYLLAALNTYNQRASWNAYYESIPPKEIFENAEFLILTEAARQRLPLDASRYKEISRFQREDGAVLIFKSRKPDTDSYRNLYSQAYLKENSRLTTEEAQVVQLDMLRSAILAGHQEESQALWLRYPWLASEDPSPRPLYSMGGYEDLEKVVANARTRRARREAIR
ncbi:MAG: hypothetical protein P8M78_14950 [Myxococcota bacterium]|nr:hypothetical protein [Myxococcota bacterium]